MPISSARLLFFAFHVLFLVNSEVHQLRNPEQYHPGYYIHPYYEPVEALVSAKNISSETADTLVIVHSAIDNYERRKLIRETYASVHERYMHNFDILFVLGTDHFGSIPTKVLKEAEKHGDMLIGDFVDVYHNTTVKMLFWMRAMAKDYLFTVRYLHTDDDVILDMKSILNFYNDPDIQSRPWLSTPIQTVLAGLFLTFSTPLCCALFPQKATIRVSLLEAELREYIEALPNAPKYVYYNKGL